MSGRTIEIAEHLWVVLETMARDMATEPRALVNQAVFNWARQNGYSVSAAASPPAAPAEQPAASLASAAVSAPARPQPREAPTEQPKASGVDEPAKTVAKTVDEPAKVVAKAAEEPAKVVAKAADEPAKVVAKAAVAFPSVSARIAAIDAEVDRYCLAPVVVDAQFGDDDTSQDGDDDEGPAEEEESAQPPDDAGSELADDAAQGDEDDDVGDATEEPPVAHVRPGPVIDVAVLRVAAAQRVVAIDRAVDDVLPRPLAAAPIPVPAPAPPAAAAPVSAPAQLPPAARPTLTVAPATLAASSPPAPSPAPAVATAAAEAPGSGKARPRLNTSELNNLLGEVDDILGQNVVRDTALSPAISFVLELRVRGTDQVCIVATEPVVIGRGSHCDLVIKSAEASREHAVVTRKGATYVIEDRGSSNGTWFGAEQVRSREIHSGDVFRIGSVDVVASFKVADAQAKAGRQITA